MQFENRSLFDEFDEDEPVSQSEQAVAPQRDLAQLDDSPTVVEIYAPDEGALSSEYVALHSEVDISITTDRLNDKQMTFVDMDDWWKQEWRGMPEFIQEDGNPYKTLYVHFRTIDDMKEFALLVEQQILTSTLSIWYPKKERRDWMMYAYVDEK